MNPSEITVIVYRAKGLQGKRKNKHKYNVTFGIGNNKAKGDNVDDGEGNPEWNTEAQLNIDDPLDPLIIKVKDKDDILGQISLHMHELPTSKPARPKSIPLQPHKKCPHPQGDVVFEAWISNYSDHAPPPSGKSKHKEKTLASQMAQFRGAGGSSESIGSTVSGFSTVSEATKKKSTLKKLKGAFKHSPKLGRSKMQSKASAQSCMDLTYGQAGLSVQNIDFKGSRESLASQNSEISKKSGDEKKSKNPFKKLKMGKSPLTGRKELTLSKKNSSSMHDLAFGGQGLSVAQSGSSESLDKLANKSRMDAHFPGKFDLTAPTAVIAALAEKEKEKEEKLKKEKEKERKEQEVKKKEDTVSIHSGDGISPKTSQRRRLSVQTRSLRDDPRLRKAPANGSPLSTRYVDAITPVSSRENVRGPTLGSSNENVSLSPGDAYSAHREKLNSEGDTRSLRSTSSHEYDQNSSTFYMSTPPAKKKLTSERPLPEITGVSPSQGPNTGGTKLTIRGTNLGLDKADVVCMNICGANCLGALEYVSDRKLLVTTKPWKPGPGKIIVETQSGGRAHSLVEFTFVEEEEEEEEEVSKPPPSPVMQTRALPVSPPPSSPPPADDVFATYRSLPEEAQTPPSAPRRRSPNGSPEAPTTSTTVADDGETVKRTPPPKPARVFRTSDVTPPPSPKKVAPPPPSSQTSPQPPPKHSVQTPEPVTRRPETKQTKQAVVEELPQATATHTPVESGIPKAAVTESPLSVGIPEFQERQEPEGMTMVKEHKSPEAKHVDVLRKEKLSPVRDIRKQTTDDSGPSRDELLRMISELQAEKTALQLENASMKGYMEKIIDKVIDRCPDVLCIDPNGGGQRSPLKLS